MGAASEGGEHASEGVAVTDGEERGRRTMASGT
jgi:hypothetical protein